MSHSAISKCTLLGLRDDTQRLCLLAGRHDEQLRELFRALESGDETGISTEASELARGALHSGSQVHGIAQSLLARLEADVAERTQAGIRPLAAVLVVDDLEDARVLVATTLLHAGFTVRTAENGLEALISAYEWQPTVIIMDITMPVLDGIEATRLIKAAKATRYPRVIAYTARPDSAETHLPQLFDAVLPKPCTPDLLLAAVRELASRPA